MISKHPSRLILATLALAVMTLAGGRSISADGAKTSASPEKSAYFGHLVDFSAPFPRQRTQPMKIWVDRFTTDSEAAAFSDLAQVKGVDALKKALEEDSIGRIQIGNRFTYPIAYARKTVDESGQHLLLLAQRPVSFREVFNNTRSSDYDFTLVQLDLDVSGEGSGEVLTAAKIKLRKSGEIEIENFDVVAARLLRVEPLGN